MTNQFSGGLSRRSFAKIVGGAALAAPMLSTRAFAATDATIKIGWVGPRSGPLGIFGEADAWLTQRFLDVNKDGVEINGKTYGFDVVLADTESDPVRASQVTKDLINGQNPDIVIASSTPETTNPVADACEAAGVPCITSIAPWESWFFGRGGKPGEPSPFKWTFHFSFGAGDFLTVYKDQWGKIETNKKVGMLMPNDADGNAVRANLMPALEKAGFECFDPGPYEDGSSDYTAQINFFKAKGVEIVNAFPFPPDFPVFWRQMAQLGLSQKLKIMQIAKAGLFPAEMEGLGQLGYGVATGAYWHKAFPTKSAALNLTSGEIAAGFEKALNKQWTQQPGAQSAMLDVVLAAMVASGNPKDKGAVAAAIPGLSVDTPVGTVDFANGPIPGVATTPIVGCQWVKASGGAYEYALEITGNAMAPWAPITAPLKPYRIGG